MTNELEIMTKREHTILHKPWVFTRNYKIKKLKMEEQYYEQ